MHISPSLECDPLQLAELKKALILFRTPVSGYNILFYAIFQRADDLLNLLEEHKLLPKSFYSRIEQDISALVLGVRNSKYHLVKNLLDEKQAPYCNLFWEAVSSHDLQMVKLLKNYFVLNVNMHYLCIALNYTHSKADLQLAMIDYLIKQGTPILEYVQINAKFFTYPELAKKTENTAVINLIKKEYSDRKLLNKTIPLLFFGSQKDPNSTIYGLPSKTIETIADYARYRR